MDAGYHHEARNGKKPRALRIKVIIVFKVAWQLFKSRRLSNLKAQRGAFQPPLVLVVSHLFKIN